MKTHYLPNIKLLKIIDYIAKRTGNRSIFSKYICTSYINAHEKKCESNFSLWKTPCGLDSKVNGHRPSVTNNWDEVDCLKCTSSKSRYVYSLKGIVANIEHDIANAFATLVIEEMALEEMFEYIEGFQSRYIKYHENIVKLINRLNDEILAIKME